MLTLVNEPQCHSLDLRPQWNPNPNPNCRMRTPLLAHLTTFLSVSAPVTRTGLSPLLLCPSVSALSLSFRVRMREGIVDHYGGQQLDARDGGKQRRGCELPICRIIVIMRHLAAPINPVPTCSAPCPFVGEAGRTLLSPSGDGRESRDIRSPTRHPSHTAIVPLPRVRQTRAPSLSSVLSLFRGCETDRWRHTWSCRARNTP
jgi:hypothetical protein